MWGGAHVCVHMGLLLSHVVGLLLAVLSCVWLIHWGDVWHAHRHKMTARVFGVSPAQFLQHT